MFGGHGLFAPHGGIFACIVDEDRIILKLEDLTARAELVALGGEPWTYAGKVTMKAWIVIPETFYDDTGLLEEWAARAHRLAPAKVRKAVKKVRAAPAKANAPTKNPRTTAGSKPKGPAKAVKKKAASRR
jgi:TfoX/Sxy family transcriptional regulator of competence genes